MKICVDLIITCFYSNDNVTAVEYGYDYNETHDQKYLWFQLPNVFRSALNDFANSLYLHEPNVLYTKHHII